MAAGPGAAESTGIGSGRGGTGSAAPRRPSQPSLRGPHHGPSHPETRAQIHVSLSLRAAAAQGWGARSERDLGIPGGTEGAAGHRADLDPGGRSAAPQPVLPAQDPDCDPRRPPPSAEACARQAATPEPPGPPLPGGRRARRPAGVANFEAKLLEGPGEQPAAIGRLGARPPGASPGALGTRGPGLTCAPRRRTMLSGRGSAAVSPPAPPARAPPAARPRPGSSQPPPPRGGRQPPS